MSKLVYVVQETANGDAFDMFYGFDETAATAYALDRYQRMTAHDRKRTTVEVFGYDVEDITGYATAKGAYLRWLLLDRNTGADHYAKVRTAYRVASVNNWDEYEIGHAFDRRDAERMRDYAVAEAEEFNATQEEPDDISVLIQECAVADDGTDVDLCFLVDYNVLSTERVYC